MLAVEMRQITKRFPGMVANDKIDLLVEQGHIHSLLGENGAGKSTLMKILFGLYRADEGTVSIGGQTVSVASPRMAYRLGIGMVHQHFMLVDNLTVLENIILGDEPGRLMVDKKSARRNVQKLSDQYNFHLDLDAKVASLSVGMKQRVEILKTLCRGAEIIILDEPTAVLTPIEVTQLLDILVDMKNQGKTIIFITHKLKETMAISDRVTVLRSGKSIATLAAEDTTAQELASLMVGSDISLAIEKQEKEPGDTVLSIQDVPLLPNAASPISFTIRAGEIFGIAGVEGNGQQQLEELVMGLARCKSGTISLKGKDITALPPRARRGMGIGYIPSDRYKQAILPGFSLSDNYLLGNQYDKAYVRRGIVDYQKLSSRTGELMKQFDVRAVSKDQLVGALSGGNQQKLVLGREVGKNPDFVLACQPVRGLDIGAIKYIHQVLLALRQQGKAVLLISAELSDLFQLSDRIGVLYKGELMAVGDAKSYTNETISLLMAGRKVESDGEK